MTVSMGFISGILSYELLKYNHNITYEEALTIVTDVLARHEGEPDTGTLWLMMIQEVEGAARDYLTTKALNYGRENQGSAQI